MKKYLKNVAGIMLLSIGHAGVTLAADYSEFSTDELTEMRSQASTLSDEDRASYRNELQSRVQSMSSEERSLFREMNGAGANGEGSGNMNRYGQGNSSGSGNMNRYGQGNSNGSGNMNRYGQGNGSGSGSMNRYGSGYGSRSGGR
ncbi:MAG: hypothetical protein C0631_10750 [Sedimenticola sp.]|jgi:hypothetical protein|nr:MAG: hypothetical protein C0631_10750 [Sedimenticola sp.]